jgi:transposase
LRIKYLCEDLEVLRGRLKDLARDIELKLDDHEVGKLLTTIDGVGPLTAACLIAELGDPARFRSAGAIASYVGVAPRLRQSGKKRFSGSPTIPFGNARLRKALWMVVLNAVRCNPWLRQYYERLRAAGKPGKVAVIAAMRKLLAAVWSAARPATPTTKSHPLRETPRWFSEPWSSLRGQSRRSRLRRMDHRRCDAVGRIRRRRQTLAD